MLLLEVSSLHTRILFQSHKIEIMHPRFFQEVFPIVCYIPTCRGQFHFVEQGDTEGSVEFLPLRKGEFTTHSVLGKLNSVNWVNFELLTSQMLTHISSSLCWRREMGKTAVMLKSAPVAAESRAAKENLLRPRSCWVLQPRACRRCHGKNKPGGAPLKPEGNGKAAGQHQRNKL